MNRRIIIAAALVVFFLALIADAALGNTIYMPSVSRSKPSEPTVAPGATPTAFVSPGGPIFRVTLTPTVAPTQEPQP